jgi:hypothetical protein
MALIAGTRLLHARGQAAALAGYVAEDLFKHPLPGWASGADHLQVAALLVDLPEMQADVLRDDGHERAQKL